MAVIDGRLQLRDWIDRNGNKRRSAEILANSVHFHAQAGRQVCRQLRRGTREAVFNSDGTNEHVWNIDKGQPLSPTVGQIYVNRGGGKYLCRALVTEHGAL